MKKLLRLFTVPAAVLIMHNGTAQSTYTNTDFAANGDTIFLTLAQPGVFNFDTTGTGITWDYSALTGISQRRLLWRNPTQTGFSSVQWPYINNSLNVNTSSTDQQTISVGSLTYSDPNDYYKIMSTSLSQKASSYRIAYNNTSFAVRNQYNNPDVIYKFPLNYGSKDSSVADYSTSIPGVYYRETSIKRVNHVEGWGTVMTPYGTFSNALKLVSDVMQIDTIAFDTITPPKDTLFYKEIQWLDPSRNYPVLFVKKIKVQGAWITEKVEYYDNSFCYDPMALFVYYPVSPWMGDTVIFQNLSTNAHEFEWNFGDPASGADNNSTLTNPVHRFDTAGIYYVTLISKNCTLDDTIILPINVRDTVAPTANFSWNPIPAYAGDTVFFTNTSQHASVYSWNFDDAASGTQNVSAQQNPLHHYSDPGMYNVRLIAANSAGSDTLYQVVEVDSLTLGTAHSVHHSEFKLYPNPAKSFVNFTNPSPGKTFAVTVYNSLGASVQPKKFYSADMVVLDVSALHEGIYFLQVESESGNYFKRVIVNR